MVGFLAILFGSVVYVFVLIGSFVGICAVFSLHALLRQRIIRRFVRSVRKQFQSLQARSAHLLEETRTHKPLHLSRVSTVVFQQVRTLLRTAQRLQAHGREEEAERTLIQALTIQPKTVVVQEQLAKLYLLTNRDQKAEAMYRELLHHSDDPAHYAALGVAEYRQGKYRESCLSYQEAMKRDPKNPERFAALGRACVAAQCFTEAIPHLEKATLACSRNTELLHLLAECYLRTGEAEKSEEAYRRIHRVEPYNEEVKEKLLSLARA